MMKVRNTKANTKANGAPDGTRLVPPAVAFPSRTLEAGNVLYQEGREPVSLYVVEHGLLKAVVPSILGRERIVDLYGPGDVLGIAALDGKPHRETVIAMESSTLTPIEPQLAASDKRLSRYLLTQLARQWRRVREALHDSELPVGARVARTLLRLSERFGRPVGTTETANGKARAASAEDTVLLPLPLTHEDLASLMRSTRVTVTRVLGELRNRHAVEGGRGNYLTHPSRLQAAADAYLLQAA